MASSDATPTVVFPLYQGCTLLDFAGATEVFSFGANFPVVWAAETCEPILTTENVRVLPGKTFQEILDGGLAADIVFVPGGGPAVADEMQNPAFVGFLKAAATRAQWVGSICTGAFLVATAGLFDGCEATTYWSQLPNLKRFPSVTVPPGYPRWVIDEDQRRFSGGGVSSSIDLALELVQLLLGVEARQRAQLSIQYAPDPPQPPSGDPTKVPPEILVEVTEGQASFTAAIRAGVDAVTGTGG
jgi:cyclohexyl-isocyanide hydratase